MLILALDASTYAGTVALIRDGAVLREGIAPMKGENEERLMPAVAGLLADEGIPVEDLGAVACGAGPGSFTSLRIAASIAKGIATARQVPLLVTPSPLLIVSGARPELPAGTYLAVLDAMRGDLFGLEVRLDRGGALAIEGDPWCAPRGEVVRRATELGASLVGPGEGSDQAPHARGFAAVIGAGLATRVDTAKWQPEYGRKAEAQVRWEVAHGRPLEPGSA